MWYERGGGAEGESFYSSDAGATYHLWEDATAGLTLAGGQFSGTVYKAALSPSNGTVNLMVGGVLRKVAGDGGTLDIGSWNNGNTTPGIATGTLNQTGGTVDNTVSDTHIGRDNGVIGNWNISGGTATLARLNVGNDGIGTLTMTGGSIDASEVHVGANGTSTGTANLHGGVLTTQFIEAGAGAATLSFDGGTLRARGDESNFIRNFDNAGAHSAINIEDGDATIDTNGFNARIQAANVIANPGDTAIDGLAGNVLNKDGAGTLTLETAAGDGNLTVHVLDGTLDFEASSAVDGLIIEAGATVTLTSLASPPAPADNGGAAASSVVSGDGGADDLGGDVAAGQVATGGIQTVPEPGVLSLLTIGLFGLIARRGRGKRD
jgi:fibronectin-binding autotransporter adhesin